MFFKSIKKGSKTWVILENKRLRIWTLSCLTYKHMFKLLDSFIGIFVLILLIKMFMPQEIGDLISELFLKVFTLLNDLLAQAQI